MYDVLKTVISRGGYKLDEIQYKIKKLYALGDLTEEQLDELLTLSQGNVSADAERPETLAMLQELAARVEAVEKKLTAQEDNETEQPEYEAWVAWDGISDKYQSDAIVSHNGKLWQSVFNGQNVWEPGAAGTENLWMEYTPETEA